jgi:hypothetical protein
VLNNFLASGTLNQTEGWSAGFNTTIPQVALTQADSTLAAYITANMPNATIGQVFGGRKIILQQPPVLPTSLPNHLVSVGARYATLPALLEQQITFAFGMDVDGTPLNPQTFPWPQMNNQQVTLSFRPASQADQIALNPLQVNNARTRLEATLATMQANVPAQVAALTREQMLGDLFQTGVLSYYAQYTAAGYLTGLLGADAVWLEMSRGTVIAIRSLIYGLLGVSLAATVIIALSQTTHLPALDRLVRVVLMVALLSPLLVLMGRSAITGACAGHRCRWVRMDCASRCATRTPGWSLAYRSDWSVLTANFC